MSALKATIARPCRAAFSHDHLRSFAAFVLHSNDVHLLLPEAFDFAPGGRFAALVGTVSELRDHAFEAGLINQMIHRVIDSWRRFAELGTRSEGSGEAIGRPACRPYGGLTAQGGAHSGSTTAVEIRLLWMHYH
ncbi:hypothetical protein [Mesorhizobium sp. M0496]|uniref:hypothetical protein n=1 Tax=Mesorhizobium sp. M0496 TaxID=2956952 RepID=UPI0033361A9F